MTDYEMKLFESLGKLDALYGTIGVMIGLLILILGVLSWIYLKSFFNKKAESFFNQSLANHQAKLIDEIGKKFIEQKGNIDREITNLKGEIEKDISHIQSDLQLITNQKNNFLNQKKDAIVEFYSAHTHWFRTILKIEPLLLSEGGELYHKYVQLMNEAQTRCEISEGKLDLYCYEENLTKPKDSLIKYTKYLHTNKEAYAFKIQGLVDKGEERHGGELDQIADKHSEKEEEIYTKVKQLRKDLRIKLSELLSEISN